MLATLHIVLTSLVAVLAFVLWYLFRRVRRNRALVVGSGLIVVIIFVLSLFFMTRSLTSAGVRTVQVDRILDFIDEHIPASRDYGLIDFGAGEGAFMEACINRGIFRFVKGVELEDGLASRARAKGLDVVTADMTLFDTRPHAPAIVYMYEPLWKLPSGQASTIYADVLTKLREQGVRYIVYYGGLLETHITEDLVRECGWGLSSTTTVASKRLFIYDSGNSVDRSSRADWT